MADQIGASSLTGSTSLSAPIPASVLSKNSNFDSGQFSVAGVSATKIAEEFQTPVFVIDEADFFARAALFKNALEVAAGAKAGHCYYAGKAFLCKEVVKWVDKAGLALDVCTGGELEVALAAGFPTRRIEFHGNNKSVAEIRRAISVGVDLIIVDSEIELERVSEIASQLKKVQSILIRLTPGVEAHTHQYIATAHEDVKFGLSIASGAAMNVMTKALALPAVNLRGVHFHIGSQITSAEGFELAIKRTIEFLADFTKKSGKEIEEFDIGGGYAISYTRDDQALDPAGIINALVAAIRGESNRVGITMPKVSIEPGRAIIGPTTATIYEVGTVKEVELDEGVRNYISVDGGMSDNIRTSLYDAIYSVALANRISSAPKKSSRVVGKHCESGDIVVRDCELPGDVKPGDLLVTPATGAYGRSMASNYNHVPRPPVVAIRDGKARVIVRRETVEDLLGLDQ
jgi:diaminopimelate decarboxylase